MVIVKELENTFFGVVIPGGGSDKKVEVKGKQILNLTMASLDTTVDSRFSLKPVFKQHEWRINIKLKGDEHVPVMAEKSDNSKFLVCTLSKTKQLQQPLQLTFNAGESVSFYLNSKKGSVHLTGYYMIEDHFDQGDHDHAHCMGEHPSGNQLDYFYKQHEGESDEDDDDDEDEDEDEDEDDDDDDDDDDVDDDDDDDDDDEEDDDDDDDDDDDEEEEDEKTKNGAKRKTNGVDKKENKKLKEDDDKPPKLVKIAEESNEKKLAGGLIVKDLKEGKGPEAKKGKTVHVYYSGRLKQNGKQFDACQSGKPFKFRLGQGEVIKGWDVGVENMKVGGKRQLIVPPNLGYGNKRMGNDIPANSTLIFDVELKAVS